MTAKCLAVQLEYLKGYGFNISYKTADHKNNYIVIFSHIIACKLHLHKTNFMSLKTIFFLPRISL